jgi:hypothetical protein
MDRHDDPYLVFLNIQFCRNYAVPKASSDRSISKGKDRRGLVSPDRRGSSFRWYALGVASSVARVYRRGRVMRSRSFAAALLSSNLSANLSPSLYFLLGLPISLSLSSDQDQEGQNGRRYLGETIWGSHTQSNGVISTFWNLLYVQVKYD